MLKFLDDMDAARFDAIGSYGHVNPYTRNDPTESPLVRIGKDIIDSKPKLPYEVMLPLTSVERIEYDVLGFRERIDTCHEHGMPNCYRCTP